MYHLIDIRLGAYCNSLTYRPLRSLVDRFEFENYACNARPRGATLRTMPTLCCKHVVYLRSFQIPRAFGHAKHFTCHSLLPIQRTRTNKIV